MKALSNTLRRQEGAALLLGLLLLAALTLLAMAGTADGRLQWRMAANLASEEAALQRARSALAWGERWLLSMDGAVRPLACAGRNCDPAVPIHRPGSEPLHPERLDEAWWRDQGLVDGWDPATGRRVTQRSPAGAPPGRWWIEELHVSPPAAAKGMSPETATPELAYYRVLARAARRAGGEPVVLESLVTRPWGDSAWRDELLGAAPGVSFCHALRTRHACGRRAFRRLR